MWRRPPSSRAEMALSAAAPNRSHPRSTRRCQLHIPRWPPGRTRPRAEQVRLRGAVVPMSCPVRSETTPRLRSARQRLPRTRSGLGGHCRMASWPLWRSDGVGEVPKAEAEAEVPGSVVARARSTPGRSTIEYPIRADRHTSLPGDSGKPQACGCQVATDLRVARSSCALYRPSVGELKCFVGRPTVCSDKGMPVVAPTERAGEIGPMKSRAPWAPDVASDGHNLSGEPR